MKKHFNAKSLIGLWGLVLVLFVSSCTQFEAADPADDLTQDPTSDVNGINNARLLEGPILFIGTNGGNATCADASAVGSTHTAYAYSSGRNDFNYGAFAKAWPEGLTVTVSPDGKTVSWSFTPPEGYCLGEIAVIVKGGDRSNIYKYAAGTTGGMGLVSPFTTGKKPNIAQLSNLTFCYNLIVAPEAPTAEDKFAEYCEDETITPLCAEATAPEGSTIVWYTTETGNTIATVTCLTTFGSLELWAASVNGGCESSDRTKVTLTIAEEENCDTVIDEDDCFQEETAWGGASVGDGPAWWFYFDTNGPATQIIYAGQKPTNGTITFDGNKFIINLGDWTLQNETDAVKIQGYDVLPNFRPAAGQFTYKGNALEVPVSGYRYYAIHLDVMLEIECPI